MKKVNIYIDMYNFLAYSYKYLGSRAYLDFVNIHKMFLNKEEELGKIKIYGGSSMGGLLNKLSHYPHIDIMEETIGWDNKEKRTDVNLALDMLIDAFNNNYDKAVLLSGDSDFIKAVDEVRKLNKEVFIATTEKDGVKNARKLIDYSSGVYILNKEFFIQNWLKARSFPS
ncbi:NYN domain-containing protein [Niallia sp. 03133]|uniref:NYN domain-containing protein n=1 Tax=Niallia sp. 03133 TaxID=3458060 RepID=UPI004044FF21